MCGNGNPYFVSRMLTDEIRRSYICIQISSEASHQFLLSFLNVVFYTSVVLQPIVSALVKAARWNSLTNFPCVVCQSFSARTMIVTIGMLSRGFCVRLQFPPVLILLAH